MFSILTCSWPVVHCKGLCQNRNRKQMIAWLQCFHHIQHNSLAVNCPLCKGHWSMWYPPSVSLPPTHLFLSVSLSHINMELWPVKAYANLFISFTVIRSGRWNLHLCWFSLLSVWGVRTQKKSEKWNHSYAEDKCVTHSTEITESRFMCSFTATQ